VPDIQPTAPADVENDLIGTLRHLGYGEIRHRDGRWQPMAEANGRFVGATADQVHIIDRKGAPTCRLVDAETGERVGTARLSCPVGADR